MALALGAACEYQTISVTPTRQSILRELGQEGKLQVDGRGDRAATRDRSAANLGYAVLLETYRGSGRLDRAYERITELKQEAALADLWVVDLDGTLHLYHGRFPRAGDPRAAAALERVRAVRLRGDRIYADAELIALGTRESEAAVAGLDEFNLRRFSNRDLLTLQVAVYNDAFGSGFREAAEEAATALREEGEQAFFYHGPHRSMVTLGLFSFDEHFVQEGQQRAYGPEIEALREKYPYNLVNGITVIEKNRHGEVIGEQRSQIVRVP